MIKNNMSKIIFGILIVLSMLLNILLLFSDYKKYLIFTLPCLVIFFIYFSYLYLFSSDVDNYDIKIKKILKNHYSDLVRIKKILDISKYTLTAIYDFDSLLNIQDRIDEPIFYYKEKDSITFYTIDNRLFCYYIMKKESNSNSKFEMEINEYEEKAKEKKK